MLAGTRPATARARWNSTRATAAPASATATLITIGGRDYTRGLGTTAPSEIVYYLGGAARGWSPTSASTTRPPAPCPATFTDRTPTTPRRPPAARSARATPPMTLTADLTGATWLRLVTTGSGPRRTAPRQRHTDWAAPVLTCGAAGPGDPVLPVEQTAVLLRDRHRRTGTIANPGTGGTRGAVHRVPHRRRVTACGSAPRCRATGSAAPLAAPLDLTGRSGAQVRLRTEDAGSVGEIAVQVGDDVHLVPGRPLGVDQPALQPDHHRVLRRDRVPVRHDPGRRPRSGSCGCSSTAAEWSTSTTSAPSERGPRIHLCGCALRAGVVHRGQRLPAREAAAFSMRRWP